MLVFNRIRDLQLPNNNAANQNNHIKVISYHSAVENID